MKKSIWHGAAILFSLVLLSQTVTAKTLCEVVKYCGQHCAHTRQALPVQLMTSDLKKIAPQDIGQIMRLFSSACHPNLQHNHDRACKRCEQIVMTRAKCNALSVLAIVYQEADQQADVVCSNDNHVVIKPARSQDYTNIQLGFDLYKP